MKREVFFNLCFLFRFGYGILLFIEFFCWIGLDLILIPFCFGLLGSPWKCLFSRFFDIYIYIYILLSLSLFSNICVHSIFFLGFCFGKHLLIYFLALKHLLIAFSIKEDKPLKSVNCNQKEREQSLSERRRPLELQPHRQRKICHH